MAKVLSVALDEETWLQFQHGLRQAAAELGVEKVTTSVLIRQLINQWLGGPRAPFTDGWLEGYKAAYGEVMRVVQNSLAGLAEAPPEPNRLGIPVEAEREI